ncbi:MAG: AAA family ATPase [Candidatus Peribacteraceae bacterium]|nr:AAA family ATPase [Candidatus Peribacteraceae bacterium]
MNIILIGMPGSGKSRIGRILAEKLRREFIDVDDFILEQTGKDSAEHLAELGDDKFLEFESEIVQKIKAEDAVIATSGSVPLVPAGIDHLKQDGFVVWLRPPLEFIEKRVAKRRDGVTRIVGAQSKTIAEILAWRESEYDHHQNAVLEMDSELPKEAAAEKLIELLRERKIID